MTDPVEIARARNELITDRIRERIGAICEAVPPIDPPYQYWLDSECSASYCRSCAIKARAEEFGFGPPLHEEWWRRNTELEQAFFDGIDGGFELLNQDSTEACETCGVTLSYLLTDYGVDDEIGYYRECPIAELRGEDSYALDRLTLNIWVGSPRPQVLGAAIVVNQAWRLAVRQHLLGDQE